MKTKVRISGNTGSKLHFVKLVKEYTGLGLKESKDLVDSMIPMTNYMTNVTGKPSTNYLDIEVESGEVQRIKKELEEIGLKVEANMREAKMKRILYEDQATCINERYK